MPPVAPAFRQSAAPTSAYNRHIQTTAAQKHIYDNPPPDPVRIRTERDILEAHHRFLHPATAPEDEETALARAYYEKLFKEFAVMELSRWREGMVAMRWRTADEVKKGLGEKVCGSLRCGESEGLECREVDFKYQEKGKDERALVKVWVCEKCCRKLVRAQNGGKKEEKNNERHRHRRRRDEEHNSERSRSTTKR
ncbi:folate-sensitive fragile site protein Fra10Ac1-domain-containing protein, partial [Geopyxis carbonaria]